MAKNIVFEGWLTKSPPNRRIWRTRWRRRWFALRQSGELPGQYFLDYYADRNCRRLKGTIDLDLCEQVDAGLHMERNGQTTNIRGSVFTIQTQHRTYHLEAECKAEMEQWVDAICRVCGLRSTEAVPPTTATRLKVLAEPQPGPSRRKDTYQNSLSPKSALNDHYEIPDSTGPYIPISECITGVRAQDEKRAFTFDPKNIVMSTRRDGHQHYTSQPHIRVNPELSENDSNLSDDDEASLHASHQNLPDWAVTKSFTKLSVSARNGSEEGPPVPPRPPKTFAGRNRDGPVKDHFQGPRIQEPVEIHENPMHGPRYRVPRRLSQGAPSSPGRVHVPVSPCPEEEDEFAVGHASLQYCNMPSLPPAVDRALKPRHSSHSIGQINVMAQPKEMCDKCKTCTCRSSSVPPTEPPVPLPPKKSGGQAGQAEENKPDVLQYLDLDLHTSKPPQSKSKGPDQRKRLEIALGKSISAVDGDSAYKTVDFLKTEAFNITRQDAEASRSFQY